MSARMEHRKGGSLLEGKVVIRTGFPTAGFESVFANTGIRLVRAPLVTEKDILENAADADAVLSTAVDPFTAPVIRSLKKCRILSRIGIGYNNIDVEEATRQGIAVAVVLDASVHEVSDHAMAFLLALSRNLVPLNRAIRQGIWRPGSPEITAVRGRMMRLNTQTLGIVGVGRIGTRTAGKAGAFGLRVLGYDPYLSADEMRERGTVKVDFEQLLRGSDYISLHAPLTRETEKMFGLQELRKMKPTAFLINTARGGLIDEKALFQALQEGSLAGAGVDVNEPEPPSPDNPLFTLDQVLFSGHSAFFSESSMWELQVRSAEAVVLALQGKWPPFLANPEVKERENRRIHEVKV
jgi:D-3-phosphoglycerate dehydrogenase / 2-oxoglutarate reductase